MTTFGVATHESRCRMSTARPQRSRLLPTGRSGLPIRSATGSVGSRPPVSQPLSRYPQRTPSGRSHVGTRWSRSRSRNPRSIRSDELLLQAKKPSPDPTPGSGPLGIAAGSDGALWFVEHLGNNVGRVTTTGDFSEARIPRRAARPCASRQGRTRVVVHGVRGQKNRQDYDWPRDTFSDSDGEPNGNADARPWPGAAIRTLSPPLMLLGLGWDFRGGSVPIEATLSRSSGRPSNLLEPTALSRPIRP